MLLHLKALLCCCTFCATPRHIKLQPWHGVVPAQLTLHAASQLAKLISEVLSPKCKAGLQAGIFGPSPAGLTALQVFAVAMPRRPLFPGTTFPVSFRDAKLIEEIEQIQRSG